MKKIFTILFLIFAIAWSNPALATEQQHVVTFGENLNFSMERLDQAVTKIGSNAKASIVLRYGTWDLDANQTITSNINFQIPPGAVLDGAYTLTIQGPFTGSKGCFGSSLTVVFASGSVDEVLPKWFNETYLSLTRARASIAVSGIPMFLGKIAADPSTAGWGNPEGGTKWFNSTDHYWKLWNGSLIVTDTTGTTNHAELAGLLEDDHTQYLNTTRHDVVARHPLTVGGTGAITASGARTALLLDKWIDASYYATLELADTAAVAAGKLLVISQNYTLTANTVLASHVLVIPGGSFTKASTYTLTFSGSFENPSNGRCFIGFADGDITGLKESRPDWFAVNTTPGTTNMRAAINSAAQSLSAGGRLFFPYPVVYLMQSDSVVITKSNIEITGVRGATIKTTGSFTSIPGSGCATFIIYGATEGTTVYNTYIHGLKFTSDNPHASAQGNRPHAVRAVGYVRNTTIEDNWFESYNVEILWSSNSANKKTTVKNNYFTNFTTWHAINWTSDDGIYEGNIINGAGTGNEGITVAGSRNVITNNIILDCIAGISVYGSAYDAGDIVIANNYIYVKNYAVADARIGIYIHVGDDGSSTVRDLLVSNNIIKIVSTNATYGISIGISVVGAGKTDLKNNQIGIIGKGNGIYIWQNVTSALLSLVKISDNRVELTDKLTTPGASRGIMVEQASAAGPLTAYLINNFVRGFTRADGDYAYDIRYTDPGVSTYFNYIIKDCLMDGGNSYFIKHGGVIADASLDNVLIGRSTYEPAVYYPSPTGSIVWNPASLADGAGETSDEIWLPLYTEAIVDFESFVLVAAPYSLQGITCTGYVDSTRAVRIRLQNETGGVIDLASGTWKVKILK